MRSADELTQLAKALPKAAPRRVPTTYTRFEGFVRTMHAKGYTGRAMVERLLAVKEITPAEADRTRHGIYRLLRRIRHEPT